MAKHPFGPFASIQDYLDATGTKQEDLAKRLGIKPAHMSNVIRKTRNCSLILAKRISAITHVPLKSIGLDPADYDRAVK